MPSKFLEHLTETLRRSFAHMGPRQAKRMALQVVQLQERHFTELLNSMKSARERISRCRTCQDLTEADPCAICSDSDRDPMVVAVVENTQDVLVLEATKVFRGTYHVLHGSVEVGLTGPNVALAGGRGVGGGSWAFNQLLDRLAAPDSTIREVLLALDHDSEGELTSLFISSEIQKRFPDIRLTRIGVGIPFGGEIVYADPATLKRAIASRTFVENQPNGTPSAIKR